jgi:hypothetical protein
MVKPTVIIVGAGLVMMMTLASVVSMGIAQQPQTSGTIGSIQNPEACSSRPKNHTFHFLLHLMCTVL